MHLIISSYLFNNKATFDKIEIKYKFLTFFDLKKKIKKNYLNECKIIFIHNDNDNLNTIIDLIKNYNKNVQLFFINLRNFYMNDTSTYFLREFTEQYIEKKKLELILKKNDIITMPKIIIGNVFNLDVIISGVCRDISKYIFNTFHKFVYLTQYFKKTKIIIYENDSKDDTLKKLYELKKKFSNLDIIILSEKNIEGKITQRISHARNKILEYIDNHNLNPEYFISIDMDEILSDFKCNSIIHPFKDNLEWSMIGGNSMIYYDMWALRTLNEPNIDFWKNKKDLISGKYITPPQKLINYFFQISEDSKPIPVYSCFNGIGIYKYKHIIGCRYNGDETCEHISFHKQMIEKHNARLFIHPKLIVGPHKILSKPMGFYKTTKLVKNNL